jgi:broad specificity phosphatase PhoE
MEAQGRPWVNQVFTGPDQASQQTAESVVETCDGEPEIRIEDDLEEVRLGLWEGLLEREAEEKFATSFGQWQEDPWSVSIPGGEELAEAQARLVESLRKIVQRSRKQSGAVVVVLRPLAATLARLAMCDSDGTGRFWDAFEAAKTPLWVSLRRDFPWRVRQMA